MSESIGKSDKAPDAVEALLEKASPRQAPPADVEKEVRNAVRAEWEAKHSRLRRRRTWMLAAAASIVLAAIGSLFILQPPAEPAFSVAAVDRVSGEVFIRSVDGEQVQIALGTDIKTGQVFETEDRTVAGLNWHRGGSLRVAAGTRVEFLSTDEVFLHFGKIYFDSIGAESGATLQVKTQHGTVSHIGTQYMTESDDSSLVVSVREGVVSISGIHHEQTAYEGQRVQLTGSSRPSISNINGAGTAWQWVEEVSPAINVDGMNAYDFLQWVARETGRSVQFATPAAEETAKNANLIGTVDADPRSELRLRMMTVGLSAEFNEEGPTIIVTD